METVLKIKTRSGRDPQEQYPSERRYSASRVLGLSVIYFILCLFSFFMAFLILHKMTLHEHFAINCDNCTMTTTNSTISLVIIDNSTEEQAYDNTRLIKRVEKDLIFTHDTDHYIINIPGLICGVCFIMTLGAFLPFLTGLFAWKRWYEDNNITLFFLASTLSILTSALCFFVTIIFLLTTYKEKEHGSALTISVELNIVIASVLLFITSILSANMAYKGKKNDYPDDMVISKRAGKVEIKTVTKGSKKGTSPVDIINQFPKTETLSKLFQKNEKNDFPNAESNYEYQERVNNFISCSTGSNKK
ncbi:unnamed protein product [Brassicogethes aeneus]|uniref:Uncharacterized protein n=1 Tax=Brassicogethes aeneus TaxID=1431903 RepID=A0A9P0B0C4_BRAAE|nr:unnamed protein product [Brassicogethes aeneus]